MDEILICILKHKCIHAGSPIRLSWEKTPTLWKIQRLPCYVYVICWRKMSIWRDFIDKYVLENIL